jgi:hypothetical protein
MTEVAPAAITPLYEQPVLVVDPGMHSAPKNSEARRDDPTN